MILQLHIIDNITKEVQKIKRESLAMAKKKKRKKPCGQRIKSIITYTTV